LKYFQIIILLIISVAFLPGLSSALHVMLEEQITNGNFSDGLNGWTIASSGGGFEPYVSSDHCLIISAILYGSGSSQISQEVDFSHVNSLTFDWHGSVSGGTAEFQVFLDELEIFSATPSSPEKSESVDVSDIRGKKTLIFRLTGDAAISNLDNISALRSMSSLYRPTASATIALMDEGSSDLIMSYLGLDQPYVDEDSTGMNLSALAGEVFGVYSDSGLGPFALLIVFCMPFVGLWIMQRDMIIPGGIGILFSGFVLVRLPADFQGVAVMMIAVCVTAVIYSIYVRR